MKPGWFVAAIACLVMMVVFLHGNIFSPDRKAEAQSASPTPMALPAASNDELQGSDTVGTDGSSPLPAAISAPDVSPSCPVVSSVQGTITTTNPTETGRLSRDGQPTNCSKNKTFPGLVDANARHYAAHWFTNSSSYDRCYTVDVIQACNLSNVTFFTTYLNSFNAADLSANYLADIGYSPTPTGEYSFMVPSGKNFGIIVNEVNPNAGCSNYAFTLKECNCWNVSYTDTITNTDSTQTGRLSRSLPASSCTQSKTYPGTVDSLARHYDSYSLVNTASTAACIRVEVDAPNCTSTNVMFVEAYLGAFNPANLSANYLADLGASPLPYGSFSFQVPAGQTYTLVANEVNPSHPCENYTLNVSNCAYQVCMPDVRR